MLDRWWLVFRDSPAWYLRALRPGFRHLWIHGRTEGRWVILELGPTGFQVTLQEVSNLPWEPHLVLEFWREKGWTAVEVRPGMFGEKSFSGVLNCVGLAKRFLGLRRPSLITPWQLFQFLERHKNA